MHVSQITIAGSPSWFGLAYTVSVAVAMHWMKLLLAGIDGLHNQNDIAASVFVVWAAVQWNSAPLS